MQVITGISGTNTDASIEMLAQNTALAEHAASVVLHRKTFAVIKAKRNTVVLVVDMCQQSLTVMISKYCSYTAGLSAYSCFTTLKYFMASSLLTLLLALSTATAAELGVVCCSAPALAVLAKQLLLLLLLPSCGH
jgi:hypothetical protein